MRVLIDFSAVFKNFNPVEAELVDTLPARVSPDPDKINKYYEGPAGEPPPNWCFKASTTPRDVYRLETGGYMVLARERGTEKYVRQLA